MQSPIDPLDGYFGTRNLHFLGPQGSAVDLTWSWDGFANYFVVTGYSAVKMTDSLSP